MIYRLRSCEASSELLNVYKNSLSTEKKYLNEIENKIAKLKSPKALMPRQVLTEVETNMVSDFIMRTTHYFILGYTSFIALY